MASYPKKTIYYEDFSRDMIDDGLPSPDIDGNYRYNDKSVKDKLLRAILYRGIATPAAAFYSGFIAKERHIGRDKLRGVKGGAFVYANHTSAVADALTPSITLFPRTVDTLISPKNLLLKPFGRYLRYLGGIPVPTSLSAFRNFRERVNSSIDCGRLVLIYPEAHLWPYCPFLRPFGSESFTYPCRLGVPAFAMTTVYVLRRGTVVRDVYLDGPFYPDTSKPTKEAAEELAEEVRCAMKARLALSTLEVIKYLPKN
jgi:1-acyl-sn-glycerol-3-phosphate acyltransferase